MAFGSGRKWWAVPPNQNFFIVLGEETQIFDGNEAAPLSPGDDWSADVVFPGLIQAADGRLVAFYSRAAGHATEGGRITSISSSNNGRSWGQTNSEGPIISNSASVEEAGAIPTMLSGGNIGLIFQRVDLSGSTAPPSPFQRDVVYYVSADDGYSWAYRGTLPNLGTLWTSCGGSRLIERADNGRLITAVYWRNNGETRYTAQMVSSSDQGVTWGTGSVIAQDAEASSARQFEEPFLLRLADGRLLCLIRSDTDQRIYTTYSNDSGSTWQPITSSFGGWGRPSCIQMTDGTILAMTRAQTASVDDSKAVLYYSRDNGLTWAGGIMFQGGTAHYQMDYGDLVQLDTNLFGVITSQQQLSNANRCRVAFREIGINKIAPAGYYKNAQTMFWPTSNDSGVQYSNQDILNGATNWTLEFWFRKHGNTGGIQNIIGKDATTQKQINLAWNGTGLNLTLGSGSLTTTSSVYIPGSHIDLDCWHQGIIIYSGSGATNTDRLKVVWNGNDITSTLVYSASVSSSMTTQTTPTLMAVGTSPSSPGNNNLRNTYLSNIRLWNSASATIAYATGTMYNNRVPQPNSAFTGTLGLPVFFLRYNGDFGDQIGFYTGSVPFGFVSASSDWGN